MTKGCWLSITVAALLVKLGCSDATAYLPADAWDVQSITTSTNITIRYKTPGQDGICETTPGVKSYSGYIDLAPDLHIFFWYFDSRSDPASDPLTLFLNGGPGSDSLLGLFQELGPCRITEELESVINPYSWNNVSNLLFISQPVGTGFSYREEGPGSFNPASGGVMNSSQADPTGRFPLLGSAGAGTIDTTDKAAVSTWDALQALLSGLEIMTETPGRFRDTAFNLWTESYGGHYGPSFLRYFYEQNEKIQAGLTQGVSLNIDTLGIGNGFVDAATQIQYWPEFAVNNTYGIKVYDNEVYEYAQLALNMPGGCLYQVNACRKAAEALSGGLIDGRITAAASSNPSIAALCAKATYMCIDNVVGVYNNFGNRSAFDIRHPTDDPTPPTHFVQYLNLPHVQNALGVNLNYTPSNLDINWAFGTTGDWAYPNAFRDLEFLLEHDVRVALYYGDADYACNWFGGEALSLALNFSGSADFAASPYRPLIYQGTQYGEVRQYGNLSFTRIYEAGHEVPYYQPQAALAIFNRTINHVNVANDAHEDMDGTASNDGVKATHTESFVPLPPTDSAGLAAWSASVVASYNALDRNVNAAPTPICG